MRENKYKIKAKTKDQETRYLTARRIIPVLLLLACAVFAITQSSLFVKRTVIKHQAAAGKTIKTEVTDSSAVTGSFKAKRTHLQQLELTFDNPVPLQAKGSVTVTLTDSDNNTVGKAKVYGKDISNKELTAFKLNLDVDKGETYTWKLSTSDYKNPNGKLKIWQDSVTGNTSYNDIYTDFHTLRFLKYMLLLLLAAVFILIPRERIQERLNRKSKHPVVLDKLFSRIFFVCAPFYTFWIVECAGGSSLGHMAALLRDARHRFWINMLIYVTIILVIYAICNKTKISSILLITIGFAFGTLNQFLLAARGYQSIAADIQGARTAMNVASSYHFTWTLHWVFGVIYYTAFLAVLLSLENYKGPRWRFRPISVGLAAVAIIFSYNFFFVNNWPLHNAVTVRLNNPAINYTDNGSALSYMLTVTYTIVDKPDDYSVSKAQMLAKKYTSDSRTAADKNAPNIIAVMNESFADLNFNTKMPLSEDPIPFTHSLKENTIKGHLYMSIFGGQTPNSEFEFLTGNTLAFLPYRSVPFKNYLNEKTANLTYTLKAQGYSGNYANHPFVASGWNRTTAYPNLGFDGMNFRNNYKNARYVRDYISDESAYDKIIELYKQTRKKTDAPFYTFNVTMQNHGGYTNEQGKVDNGIKFTDKKLTDEKTLNFVNLMKESDNAIKKLITYFRKQKENTIIVFFGDHQPLLGNNFYKYAFGKNVGELDFNNTKHTYTVPYFIWANYDIPEETKDMSANYLSSYMLKTAGLKMTGYNKYLLDLQKQLPVISMTCYMSTDGKLREMTNIAENDKKNINDYNILEYNLMFDREKTINDFFYLK